MSSGGVSLTGKPIPAVTQQVGGEDPSGNLEHLNFDVSGNLLVTGTFTAVATNASVGPFGGAAPVDGTQLGYVDFDTHNYTPVTGTEGGIFTWNLGGQIKEEGQTPSNPPVFLDFSSTNVTAVTYVEIVASFFEIANSISFYNGSTVPIALAFGAVASEQNVFHMGPGQMFYPFYIPAAVRLSIISLSGTINTGLFTMNFNN